MTRRPGVGDPPGEGRLVVRTPASSANLGAGFDVFGMAVALHADLGVGDAPPDARPLDAHHPARAAFEGLGGTGPIWLRCNIPMARGLGFSGAVRVGAAALAVATSSADPRAALLERRREILELTTRLEGHGDNVAASIHGGLTVYVDGTPLVVPIGPVLRGARLVAWIPDVTTSTDRSRRALPATVDRAAAVHNISRAVQFALAVVRDDPTLLAGATDDLLHQPSRLPLVADAATALDAGVRAGAWCGWLSGSGPTIGFLADAGVADAVGRALPASGHVKILEIDTHGTRVLNGAPSDD